MDFSFCFDKEKGCVTFEIGLKYVSFYVSFVVYFDRWSGRKRKRCRIQKKS